MLQARAKTHQGEAVRAKPIESADEGFTALRTLAGPVGKSRLFGVRRVGIHICSLSLMGIGGKVLQDYLISHG